MAATQGNCFICGKTVDKTAIKKHVLKDHNSGDERCILIKAEGVYDKDYWLYFSVPFNARLSVLDDFLRRIWCECCDHLSVFRVGASEFDMSFKLSSFAVGVSLLYEYDFGSTTRITVTILNVLSRPTQEEKVQLIARNVPPQMQCVKCGADATQIDVFEVEALCDECAKDAKENDAFLPIVNSPRCGVCGYMGDHDVWTFAPPEPLPEPPATPTKGRRKKNKEEANVV
jgi:hypothetical protein